MPSVLSDEEVQIGDPYEALGVATTASEQEIRGAYRRLSLKCHPDKNPDNPNAAHQFHLLSLAYGILQDASKRSFLAARIESDRAARARREGMESKRRGMVEALLEREKAAKRQKELEKEEADREAQEEAIKAAGRKMREQAAAAAQAAQQDAASVNKSRMDSRIPKESGTRDSGNGSSSHPHPTRGDASSTTSRPMPPIDASDLTLTLQFPSIPDPTLVPPYLASLPALEDKIRTLYGPTSFVVLKSPPSTETTAGNGSSSKRKGHRAIIEFAPSNWSGCWACWKDHARKSSEGGRPLLPGTKVKWASSGGTTAGGEPAWVAWAEETQSQAHAQRDAAKQAASAEVPSATIPQSRNGPGGQQPFASSFPSSFPAPPSTKQNPQAASAFSSSSSSSSGDYEAQTMFRMRQMERQRLEDEIRRQEAEEE